MSSDGNSRRGCPDRVLPHDPDRRRGFARGACLAPGASAKGGQVVTSSSGIPYVSGGAGTEEVDQLRSMEKDFNLKMVFALTSGAYLAEGNGSIVDAGNQVVLDTLAEGPWFLARLPPGTYQVKRVTAPTSSVALSPSARGPSARSNCGGPVNDRPAGACLYVRYRTD